jgi:small-conductance mechanosensitive channel
VEKIDELIPTALDNPLVSALIILLVALVTMYVMDFVVSRVCRVYARRTRTTMDDSFIDLIHRPVRVSVLLLGLWLAVTRFELPPRTEMLISAALKTIAMLIWAVFGIRFVSLVLEHLSHVEKPKIIDSQTRPLFDNLAKVIIVAGSLYFIFLFWNINVSAWLASAGIIGIAVGFAAKDTLANLFSGIFILADAPYKLGDYINLDSGERGEVRHIGLRSTRLLTRDDVEITIPNAVAAGAKIVNESGGPWAKERVRVNLGVAYGTDVDLLREILEEIASKNDDVCKDPTPRVRFREFGESSLNFQLMCWIDEPVLRGKVIDALNTGIYKRLAREGIEIPYPKRDVYVRQMPGTGKD